MYLSNSRAIMTLVRRKPQLHEQELSDVVHRRERSGGLRRHMAHVEREDDPERRQMHRHQVDGPHARQPQPQEVQRRSPRERVAHPVEVIPRQHEAAENEEEVDALGAAVQDRGERRSESGGRLLEQWTEVKEHDPYGCDDAQSG